MNLKQLEVFLAVAESGSFSKGAAATFLTQSTASQHIAALEREFELQLLDRTGKGALPTVAGKLLVRHAGRIAAEVRAAEQALQRFKGVEAAELVLGGSNVPAAYLIPRLLPRLLQRFPGVAATIIQGDSRGILEKLSAEEVELAIVGSRFPLEGVEYEPVGSEALRLVVNRHHPWSRRRSVALAEIRTEPLLFRESGSGTGKAVTESLAKAGVERSALTIRAVFGSNEAVKQAVLQGLGASFVSEYSVNGELASGDLVAIAVEGLTITRDFYLATRAGRTLSPAALAFIDVVRTTVPQDSPA